MNLLMILVVSLMASSKALAIEKKMGKACVENSIELQADFMRLKSQTDGVLDRLLSNKQFDDFASKLEDKIQAITKASSDCDEYIQLSRSFLAETFDSIDELKAQFSQSLSAKLDSYQVVSSTKKEAKTTKKMGSSKFHYSQCESSGLSFSSLLRVQMLIENWATSLDKILVEPEIEMIMDRVKKKIIEIENTSRTCPEYTSRMESYVIHMQQRSNNLKNNINDFKDAVLHD